MLSRILKINSTATASFHNRLRNRPIKISKKTFLNVELFQVFQKTIPEFLLHFVFKIIFNQLFCPQVNLRVSFGYLKLFFDLYLELEINETFLPRHSKITHSKHYQNGTRRWRWKTWKMRRSEKYRYSMINSKKRAKIYFK